MGLVLFNQITGFRAFILTFEAVLSIQRLAPWSYTAPEKTARMHISDCMPLIIRAVLSSARSMQKLFVSKGFLAVLHGVSRFRAEF
jgi:hypothetical protein